jgi:hypothetical protein
LVKDLRVVVDPWWCIHGHRCTLISWLGLVIFRWHDPPYGWENSTVLNRSRSIWYIWSKYF